MQQAFYLKKHAPYMVVHYRDIIDSDFEIINEKLVPGAKLGGACSNSISFLVSADPSKWSA